MLLLLEPPAVVLGWEPPAALEVMLMALEGRRKGIGEALPEVMEGDMGPSEVELELGCWRMMKTKVLLRARRWHWGWTM